MKNLKIAHIILDEKFPDSAYEHFQRVAPNCSDFYIASTVKKLKYVKNISVKFVNIFSYKSKVFIRKLENYDFVVLHSLTEFNQQLVHSTIKTKIKYLWIGMGFDYYNILYPNEKDLLLESTKKLFEKSINSTGRQTIQIVKKIVKKMIYKSLNKEKIIARIDYFAPVLSLEYDLLKEKCLRNGVDKFPKYIFWNYGVNAKLIDQLDAPMINRNQNSVLLGNSATYTNNHIEILDFLQVHKNKISDILCPLSYGNEQYANIIEKIGDEYYGDKFISLRKFISYDAYLTLISKSSIVIMNHSRQQAGGNIASMLFQGATVFLREENPIYEYYKNMNILLFSIQELHKNPILLNKRLTDKEILFNRKQMKIFGGSKAVFDKTKNLIETIYDKQNQIF